MMLNAKDGKKAMAGISAPKVKSAPSSASSITMAKPQGKPRALRKKDPLLTIMVFVCAMTVAVMCWKTSQLHHDDRSQSTFVPPVSIDQASSNKIARPAPGIDRQLDRAPPPQSIQHRQQTVDDQKKPFTKLTPNVVSDAAAASTKASKMPTKEQQQQTQQRQRPQKQFTGDKPMNIVLLYADDWSFTTLGAQGNNFVKTPTIDRMAKDGMLFEQNCVTTSICMVSRATLYTGQYASRHKTWASYKNLTMYEDDNWENTLYPMLKASPHNYHVGFFGKWHHTPPPKKIDTFDEHRFYEGRHYKTRGNVTKHITQWNEEDGMGFLEQRPKDRPFMLTISFFATHAEDGTQAQYRPMNSSMWMYANSEVPVPKTFTDRHWDEMPSFFKHPKNIGRKRAVSRYYPEERYQAMMKNTYRMATEVDTVCGRVMDELERQGVLDETLIIFTTDNGNFHGQHGLAEKWFAYEESLRVPLVIRDPRMPLQTRGIPSDDFTLSIDLAPTILSAAGIEVPERMQGRDIAQLYLDPAKSKADWRKEFFYEWIGTTDAFPTNYALVRKDKKYILWPQFEYEQVFDRNKDPFEEFDLANETDSKLKEAMRIRMKTLQREVIAGAKM